MNKPLVYIGGFGLAGAVLLTACGQQLGLMGDDVGTASPSVQLVRAKRARLQSVTVRPRVFEPGFKVQATVGNLTRADIFHLVIQVFELDPLTGAETPVLDSGGNPVKADVPGAQLDNPITFSNLFSNTTYRLWAFAYRAAGEDPANLISTLDSGSYTDVAVGTDNQVSIIPLRVKLVDVDFGGSTSANGIQVTDGGYRQSGDVTITVASPTPTPAPVLTASFPADGSVDDYLSLVSVEAGTPAGTSYMVRIREVVGTFYLSWGTSSTGAPADFVSGAEVPFYNWTPGQEMALPGPAGVGSLTVRLGSYGPLIGSYANYYQAVSVN